MGGHAGSHPIHTHCIKMYRLRAVLMLASALSIVASTGAELSCFAGSTSSDTINVGLVGCNNNDMTALNFIYGFNAANGIKPLVCSFFVGGSMWRGKDMITFSSIADCNAGLRRLGESSATCSLLFINTLGFSFESNHDSVSECIEAKDKFNKLVGQYDSCESNTRCSQQGECNMAWVGSGEVTYSCTCNPGWT